ncbi:kinesin-like protein [Cymbomonas tetramitiformis]|uniref:Kinesin-like protein n=1 Tax=Cymbomonas tetramitiformis TaxID=36881 RepID=A0AAE0F547_9CHLO|nr:kinesin-like protein [Cymbomonas tetramitiformis]
MTSSPFGCWRCAGAQQEATSRRATFATNMNEHSSRSHYLLSVNVQTINNLTGAVYLGKLHLVDLAGSERISKTGAEGSRLKEAQAINKSLSALGDVISSLASKDKHIPYRNSKLTYLLQDSLGGNSKCLMFCQVSPSEEQMEETQCSLEFASRVRSVELGQAATSQKGAPAKKSSRPSAAPGSPSKPGSPGAARRPSSAASARR